MSDSPGLRTQDDGIWYPDSKSKRPRPKRYLAEMRATIVGNTWIDIPPRGAQERLGYLTLKPLALLERIIPARAATPEHGARSLLRR